MELSEFQAKCLLRAIIASDGGLSAFARAGATGHVHRIERSLEALAIYHDVKGFVGQVVDQCKEKCMGRCDHVLAAVRRDAHQDVGGQHKKQGCCKQGHQDVHGDSILGVVFFLQECVSGWNIGRCA